MIVQMATRAHVEDTAGTVVRGVLAGLPHTGEAALIDALGACSGVTVDTGMVLSRERSVALWRAYPEALVVLNVCSPVERFLRLLAELRQRDPALDLSRLLADPRLRGRYLWPGRYADVVAQLHPQQQARLHVHVADNEPAEVAHSVSVVLQRLGVESANVSAGPASAFPDAPVAAMAPHEVLQLQHVYTIPNERFFELLGREIPSWSQARR